MMLPTVISQQITGDHLANIDLLLPADLLWFSGHFPTCPILPGVAQINWVMHYANQLFGPMPVVKSIDVVKFQRPLMPDDKVTLVLNWDRTNHKLIFKYLAHSEITASSGKIALCQ
ncbi:hydroxymyristoyl-ACP dehydratase [Yersinia alsatica]|uniref:ApeI family dehydratase n=1 Tax=Yersinia alsatica TaxID=2890317 RepID=UPI000B6B7148|nr:hydroxymyristoyl-ACP dehydratase [Yersinia alsatica]OWF80336.1 hydroxymyristoyl-ACP dehydratase [Yersinia frederiksenii]